MHHQPPAQWAASRRPWSAMARPPLAPPGAVSDATSSAAGAAAAARLMEKALFSATAQAAASTPNAAAVGSATTFAAPTSSAMTRRTRPQSAGGGGGRVPMTRGFRSVRAIADRLDAEAALLHAANTTATHLQLYDGGHGTQRPASAPHARPAGSHGGAPAHGFGLGPGKLAHPPPLAPPMDTILQRASSSGRGSDNPEPLGHSGQWPGAASAAARPHSAASAGRAGSVGSTEGGLPSSRATSPAQMRPAAAGPIIEGLMSSARSSGSVAGASGASAAADPLQMPRPVPKAAQGAGGILLQLSEDLNTVDRSDPKKLWAVHALALERFIGHLGGAAGDGPGAELLRRIRDAAEHLQGHSVDDAAERVAARTRRLEADLAALRHSEARARRRVAEVSLEVENQRRLVQQRDEMVAHLTAAYNLPLHFKMRLYGANQTSTVADVREERRRRQRLLGDASVDREQVSGNGGDPAGGRHSDDDMAPGDVVFDPATGTLDPSSLEAPPGFQPLNPRFAPASRRQTPSPTRPGSPGVRRRTVGTQTEECQAEACSTTLNNTKYTSRSDGGGSFSVLLRQTHGARLEAVELKAADE